MAVPARTVHYKRPYQQGQCTIHGRISKDSALWSNHSESAQDLGPFKTKKEDEVNVVEE